MPEKLYHRVERINFNNGYNPWCFNGFKMIKNRHHIKKKLCQDIPNILNISEINTDYGKHKANTGTEYEQQHHRYKAKQGIPCNFKLRTAAYAGKFKENPNTNQTQKGNSKCDKIAEYG